MSSVANPGEGLMSTIEAAKPSALEAKIRVENLDVFYGNFQALKAVAFDIPASRAGELHNASVLSNASRR